MNLEQKIQELEIEIEEIKTRNKRVEKDKAWETSKIRILAILFLTYICTSIIFWFIAINKPFQNALIPTIAFVLSSQSLPFVKKIWIKYYKK